MSGAKLLLIHVTNAGSEKHAQGAVELKTGGGEATVCIVAGPLGQGLLDATGSRLPAIILADHRKLASAG